MRRSKRKYTQFLLKGKPATAAAVVATLQLATMALGLPQVAEAQGTVPGPTPTSPVESPRPIPDGTILPQPAPPIAPIAPIAPADTPTLDVNAPRLPPLAGRSSPSLPVTELLPASSSQAGGMTEGQAVERALSVSLGHRRAEAQVQAANAGHTAAALGFLPQTSVLARYTRLSPYELNFPGFPIPPFNQYNVQGSVSWSLTSALTSQRHALQAAQASLEAAVASKTSTDRDVVLQVQEAYWEVVRSRAHLQLATDSRALAERRVQEAEVRAQQGLITETDLLQTQSAARDFERLLAVATTRAKLAEASLRIYLDMEADAPLLIAAELAEQLPSTAVSDRELRELAGSNAPEVEAALRNAEVADAQADQQVAQMLPNLSAAFNVNYANPNQRVFPQEEKFQATWDASLQVSWSLDGTLVANYRADQQRAMAAAQRLSAEETRLNMEHRALAAHGQLLSASAAVEARQLAASAAIRNARSAQARNEVGTLPLVELSAAEAQQLSAKLDLVDALVDVRLAQASYRRAIGQAPLPTRDSQASAAAAQEKP